MVSRREHRVVDLHQHIDCAPEHLVRAVQIMDRVGIGMAVNLSGGTTTHPGDAPSEFGRNKQTADQLFPGRFIHYMNLDYSGWDQRDFDGRDACAAGRARSTEASTGDTVEAESVSS